jgi:hypothetical protein
MDQILAQVAERVMAAGLRPVGTVQINTECDRDGPCDMDVRVLPDGPMIRISQSLGPGARGCRLDPEALERSVGLVEQRLSGADCLIVNKFGKHEADGRGFRSVIGEALAQGIPVLVGINGMNRDRFDAFTEGLAETLEPDPETLSDWLLAQVAEA